MDRAADLSPKTSEQIDRTIDLDELAAAANSPERSVRGGPVAPGRILLDRYVLTRVLDSGGACTVFHARDLEATRETPAFVAVKAPMLIGAPTETARRAIERLERQFEQTKRLSHAGIVEVFDLQSEGDLRFLTMELLEGRSLAELLHSYSGAPPPALVRRILMQIADALSYAHSVGIVHGRLSPAHVFVLPGDRVKLLGFGCAQTDTPSAASRAYASPQILEGASATIQDDIYSFSSIAYEMISGHHPFERRSAKEARDENLSPEPPPQLSENQSAALLEGLAWDRETRQSDLKTLATAIVPRASRNPPPARPASPPVVTATLNERDEKRWLILIAACIAAMIVAVVVTRLG